MFVAVLLVGGTVACQKEEAEAPVPEDGGVLLLELRHPADEASLRHGLVIYAETTTEYPCLGYTIQTHHSDEGGLHIDYRDIVRPSGPCATALGPAIGSVQFDNLEVGLHSVTLTYKGETVSGRLQVTDVEYKLSLEENEVIRVVIDELTRRFPD